MGGWGDAGYVVHMECRAPALATAVVALVCVSAAAQEPHTWAPAPPGVQVTQDWLFEFSTVNAAGNTPYAGTPTTLNPWDSNESIGRGGITEAFRISRTELTVRQFVPFLNVITTNPAGPAAAWLRSTDIQHARGSFGISQDWDYQGAGVRFRETSEYASRYPVDVSWRMGALYCNWLTNGRQNDPATLLYGAYDTSTWGVDANGRATDRMEHEPGAQYWMATRDQLMAALYYDPNRYGPGQAGWWLNPTSSDAPSIPGPPGVGTAFIMPLHGGVPDIGFPLGSYAAQSPWGLLDGSGGLYEMAEDSSFFGRSWADRTEV